MRRLQVIANSFNDPGDGKSAVRLFNLSPDTPTASMSRDGAAICSNGECSNGRLVLWLLPTL